MARNSPSPFFGCFRSFHLHQGEVGCPDLLNPHFFWGAPKPSTFTRARVDVQKFPIPFFGYPRSFHLYQGEVECPDLPHTHFLGHPKTFCLHQGEVGWPEIPQSLYLGASDPSTLIRERLNGLISSIPIFLGCPKTFYLHQGEVKCPDLPHPHFLGYLGAPPGKNPIPSVEDPPDPPLPVPPCSPRGAVPAVWGRDPAGAHHARGQQHGHPARPHRAHVPPKAHHGHAEIPQHRHPHQGRGQERLLRAGGCQVSKGKRGVFKKVLKGLSSNPFEFYGDVKIPKGLR